MTETPKRPARTPAQRRADLRARAVTLLMDDEAALLQAADSLVIEAMLHAYRRKLPHDFSALSAELLRRLQAARRDCHATPEPTEVKVEVKVEPDNVTVTTPETKTTRGYPPEVRRLAVDMADEGRSSREIVEAIRDRVGRAPDVRNVAKLLKGWRAAVG